MSIDTQTRHEHRARLNHEEAAACSANNCPKDSLGWKIVTPDCQVGWEQVKKMRKRNKPTNARVILVYGNTIWNQNIRM